MVIIVHLWGFGRTLIAASFLFHQWKLFTDWVTKVKLPPKQETNKPKKTPQTKHPLKLHAAQLIYLWAQRQTGILNVYKIYKFIHPTLKDLEYFSVVQNPLILTDFLLSFIN